MTYPHRCPLCQKRDTPEETCPACAGKGIVWEPEPDKPVIASTGPLPFSCRIYVLKAPLPPWSPYTHEIPIVTPAPSTPPHNSRYPGR